MLAAGQQVGPYSLERKLGAGTFGQVWVAKHLDLDERRAIKIPTDPEYVKQLRREGKIQFRPSYPNIVKLFEVNTHSDPPYLVHLTW